MKNALNKISKLESKIMNVISAVLNTPYNWSLLVIAALIWVILHFFMYYTNMNFDMTANVHHYLGWFALTSLIIGALQMNDVRLIRMSIITFFLVLLSLIISKLVGVISFIGIFVINPLAIFCFLMLIKLLWNKNNI